ncbi:MAG: cell division protein ZapA [Hyphomicrobiales bacterium]|jgi:cell division protein ZapA|nr:cell division protein ZapA [Hyphomicrobiales bacterium]
MSQGEASSVQVTIAGRSFRMACAPGEEEHLEVLAAQIDKRIQEMRGAFGEIGDQRLTVMAAITMADELSESRRRVVDLEDQVAALQQAVSDKTDTSAAWVESMAQTIDLAARRIEGIAHSVGGVKG